MDHDVLSRKKYLKVPDELAAFLGLSPKTIRNKISLKQAPFGYPIKLYSFPFGNQKRPKRYVYRMDVEKWLRSHVVEV